MTDNGQLRVQAEPLQIFEIVLRSLEAHRPAKTETDILDRIRMRWNLSDTQAGAGGKNAVLEAWPGELVARGVKVDAFLSFVVEELGPFVEMLIELYSFLSEYVSTSGGRTEHFEIDSDALRESWAFDMSRLPKQVSWIQAWHASRVEYVAADLDNISRELLCIDNGIYYAKVGDKRALQSLIVARRDGYIPADVRRLGDQIRGAMLRVVRAYANSFGALDASAELGGRPSIRAFVPELHNLLAGRGFTTEPDLRNLVAIDPRVLEQSAPYRLEQVFLDLADDRPILTRDDKDYWSLSSLAFFCALWGLEEGDFRHAARLLTAHESRKDLFRPEEMAGAGLAAVRTLHAQVNEAIVITPSDQVVRTLRKQRLEVLLLPYWKDRWFLYEVWVLSHTLRYATRLGASVELAGVTEIARDGVVGSSWNLPTQKAQHPVAYMRGPTGSLAVWFQRETQRLDSAKHMEPDIRLMHETERDEDLLILEVKDRVKFSGSGRRVARSYLDGSRARAVWVLNYEPTASGGHTQIEELGFRRLGVIDGFRPGGAFPEFDEGLDATIGRYLGLPAEERFSQRVLIVDTSSSMAGKRLPILQLDPYLTDLIVVWSATVSGAPPEMREALKLGQRIPGVGGAERASALQNYLDTMRSNVGVTLITDCSGRRHLEEAGLITGQIPSSVMLCGRAAKLIEI